MIIGTVSDPTCIALDGKAMTGRRDMTQYRNVGAFPSMIFEFNQPRINLNITLHNISPTPPPHQNWLDGMDAVFFFCGQLTFIIYPSVRDALDSYLITTAYRLYHSFAHTCSVGLLLRIHSSG